MLANGCSNLFTEIANNKENIIVPKVQYTYPENSQLNVKSNSSILIYFNKKIDNATLISENFAILKNGSTEAGNIQVTSQGTQYVLFKTSAFLEYNTSYDIIIKNAIKDIDGISLKNDYIFTFTTGNEFDDLPPIVTTTAPEKDSVVTIKKPIISAVFSEDINPDTINKNTFQVFDRNNNPLQGDVLYNPFSKTANFNLINDLKSNTIYSACILNSESGSISDLAGLTLETPKCWQFSTDLPIADLEFIITGHTPINGSSIPHDWDKTITLTFNKPYDPASINTNNISISDGTTNYSVNSAEITNALSVQYTAPDLVADSSKTYTVTVHGNAIEEASTGIELSEDFSFSFTFSSPGTEFLYPEIPSNSKPGLYSFGQELLVEDGSTAIDNLGGILSINNSLLNYIDTASGETLAYGTFFRMEVNSTPVTTSPYDTIIPRYISLTSESVSPDGYYIDIDITNGLFALPMPVYWNSFNTVGNFTTPEIGSHITPVAPDYGTLVLSSTNCKYGNCGGVLTNSTNQGNVQIKPDLSNLSKGTISFYIQQMDGTEINRFDFYIGNISIALSYVNGFPAFSFFKVLSNGLTLIDEPYTHLTGHFYIIWNEEGIGSTGDTLKIFINGTETHNTDQTIDTAGNIRFSIASNTDNANQNIVFDNLMIWNHVVSETASWIYSGATEDTMHPVYGSANGYKINDVTVGYYTWQD